jgi:hypothetical protein
MHGDVTVEARVNPKNVLRELDTSDIVGYLKEERDIVVDTSAHCSDLVHDFFHGDFNLKALLTDLGKDAVAPLLREFIKEQAIEI